MKTLLCSFLLLFATSALAQGQAASTSNDAVQKPEPGSTPSEAISPPQQNLCYSMRSYIFERNDGSTTLAGSKTCTPASRFRAMYIPTVMNQPHLDRVAICSHSGCTTGTDPKKAVCTPSGCTTVTEPEKPNKQH